MDDVIDRSLLHRDLALVRAPRPLVSRGVRRRRAPRINLEAAGIYVANAWETGGGHIPCKTGPTRDLRDSWEVQPESFTSMIVADLLMGQHEHKSLVARICTMLEQELDASDGVFHFFKEHARLPADADCTALGLSVLLRSGALVTERAHRALDRMLSNVNDQGVVETYFDPTRERAGIVDPVVCANVLYMAHQLGRERELVATLNYVRRTIEDRSYLGGTRYYHSPDTFLYFTARLVRRFPQVHSALLRPLRAALRERQNTTNLPLDLAQRVIAAQWLGLDAAEESQALSEIQECDGCWPSDSMFRYGRKRIYFGSGALTTAFALRALRTESGFGRDLPTRTMPPAPSATTCDVAHA